MRAFMCEWTRFNILTPAATAFSVARRKRMSLGPRLSKTRAFGSHETVARPGSHLDRRARPPTTRRNCSVFTLVMPAFFLQSLEAHVYLLISLLYLSLNPKTLAITKQHLMHSHGSNNEYLQ